MKESKEQILKVLEELGIERKASNSQIDIMRNLVSTAYEVGYADANLDLLKFVKGKQ